MGNSENYENDPYIQQSQNNYAIKNLYTQSSLLTHSWGNDSSDNNQMANKKDLVSQQEKIKTQPYKNPLILDKNSILLEKEAYSKSLYYITFKYSSERETYVNVYFNSVFIPESNYSFVPSNSFSNIIKLTLPIGKDLKCQEKILCLDMDYFYQNKIYDSNSYDIIIEMFTLDKNTQNVECILATFCKILYNKNDKLNPYIVKYLCQKFKLANSPWYSIEEIYGLTSDENECGICCVNPRNTFFLPCKHSFACQDCAISLRMKKNGCPICRQPIKDSVILENANQK